MARSGLKTLRMWLDQIPARCVVCDAVATRSNLCHLCLSDLPRLTNVCQRCALPVRGSTLCGPCIVAPPPWRSMTCAVPYESPYDALIARLKYRGNQTVIPAMSALLVEALENRPPASVFDAINNPTQPSADAIVPVPLHRLRHWQRGFNQSAVLAAAINQHLNLDIIHALRRHRYTRTQTHLNARQRVSNIKRAFSIDRPVNGRHVALLDDVATTCATAAEATRALIDSGAASVQVWSFARARSKHPSILARRSTRGT